MTAFLRYLFCGTLLFPALGWSAGDLEKKEVFDDRFPKQFVFRGEYRQKQNASYGNYVNATAFSGGVIQKLVPFDEMPKIHPTKTLGFASRYAKENPGKLMLLHWNAEEHVNSIGTSAKKYFPGHWYTYEGSVLSSEITAGDEWIVVEDIRPFDRETRNRKARSKWRCPMLLLVEVDREGMAVWEHYEYVEMLEVDKKGSRIRVKRGQALSEARSFKKGSRLAGIATYLSTPHLFGFNYSSEGPRDRNGRRAIDVQFGELVELFDKERGLLRDLDGIAFDVLNWEPPHDRHLIDSNGDGKADGAYDLKTGEDLWRKGAYEFQKRLRDHFGPDFILMNDGYNRKDQRALDVFNGIESEGLVWHNDAFRGFSKTINVFTYWAENNRVKYRLSTIVPKVNNPVDQMEREKYVRLCIATATCLGAAVNMPPVMDADEVPDEIKGGSLNRMYWLGKALGAMRNRGIEGVDLLGGAGQRMDAGFLDAWKSEKCSMKFEAGVLHVEGVRKDRFRENCILRMAEFQIPEDVNDITVVFEIKANEGLSRMDERVPRRVSFSAEGLPKYEQNVQLNHLYNDMWGLAGTSGYTQLSFYYRNVAGRKLVFSMEVEGQGGFSIRGFRINASTAALSREFENGVVLVNPSLKDYTFELDFMAGGSAFRRLDGKGFPNDASRVKDKVTLGPLEGLFLLREE